MVTLFVVGLLWVVVYYVTQTEYPIGGLGLWNMAIAFAFIIAAFARFSFITAVTGYLNKGVCHTPLQSDFLSGCF